MVLTLYCSSGSPPCRSVLMLLNKLNLTDVKLVDVNLVEREQFQESFLKMNPQHTIPTLKDDDFIFWDSHAIAIYLITLYGKDNNNNLLYPNDPKKRAIINQRIFFDSERLFPAIGVLAPMLYAGEKTLKKEDLSKISETYDFAEKFLTKNYFAGDEITLADICCASSISTLNLISPIDKNTYPKLRSWLDRISKEEFYKQGNEPGLNVLNQYIQMLMS